MFRLINTPNLPKNKVYHCLIGEKYSEEIKELTESGIECIPLKRNTLLDEETDSHADILSFNTGCGKILVNQGSVGESELIKLGLQVIFSEKISSPYPADIRLNGALIGNNIICNSKHISPKILSLADGNNIEIINTKQGYSRCNLCIINENTVITEDDSLAYLLKNYQFNVLKVSSGSVGLSEAHYGFLGGASGKLSESEIYFSGDLSAHSDYEQIAEFLCKHNVKAIFNKNRPLRDFGGFVQLTEYI